MGFIILLYCLLLSTVLSHQHHHRKSVIFDLLTSQLKEFENVAFDDLGEKHLMASRMITTLMTKNFTDIVDTPLASFPKYFDALMSLNKKFNEGLITKENYCEYCSYELNTFAFNDISKKYINYLAAPTLESQNELKDECSNYNVPDVCLNQRFEDFVGIVPAEFIRLGNHSDHTMSDLIKATKKTAIQSLLLLPLCSKLQNRRRILNLKEKNERHLLHVIKISKALMTYWNRERILKFWDIEIMKPLVMRILANETDYSVIVTSVYDTLKDQYSKTGYQFGVIVFNDEIDQIMIGEVLLIKGQNITVGLIRSLDYDLGCDIIEHYPSFKNKICESSNWGKNFNQIASYITERCSGAKDMFMLNLKSDTQFFYKMDVKLRAKIMHLSSGWLVERCYPKIFMAIGFENDILL